MAGGTLRHWRSRRSGCRQASPPPARNRRAGWHAYTRTCSRTVHRYFRQLTLKVQGSLACTRRAARRAGTSQTSQHGELRAIRLDSRAKCPLPPLCGGLSPRLASRLLPAHHRWATEHLNLEGNIHIPRARLLDRRARRTLHKETRDSRCV